MLKTAKSKLLKIFTKVDRQIDIHRYPDFGPLEIPDYDMFLHSSKTVFNMFWKNPVQYNDSLKSFDIIDHLGEGVFSEVFLVKHLENEKYYAMKVVEKENILRNKQVQHSLSEKLVLQGLNHPFTVHLVCFFMDNCNLYFVLPLIPCGELFKHLAECQKFSEQQTRFFVAQIVLALEYLHYLNLIYRDLKPENVLIDHLGYLKLTDFGFCKKVKGRTYTFCGTPQYLAPESVLGLGYSGAVDWWALGVFTFELSSGRSPFSAAVIEEMFDNIITCKYKMETKFSPELQHFICSLLEKDLTRRIGNLKGRVQDIKNHKWFRPINWITILNRKAPADFLPTCDNIGDKDKESVASLKMKLCSEDYDKKYGKIFNKF